jgi:hypothetical protein
MRPWLWYLWVCLEASSWSCACQAAPRRVRLHIPHLIVLSVCPPQASRLLRRADEHSQGLQQRVTAAEAGMAAAQAACRQTEAAAAAAAEAASLSAAALQQSEAARAKAARSALDSLHSLRATHATPTASAISAATRAAQTAIADLECIVQAPTTTTGPSHPRSDRGSAPEEAAVGALVASLQAAHAQVLRFQAVEVEAALSSLSEADSYARASLEALDRPPGVLRIIFFVLSFSRFLFLLGQCLGCLVCAARSRCC